MEIETRFTGGVIQHEIEWRWEKYGSYDYLACYVKQTSLSAELDRAIINRDFAIQVWPEGLRYSDIGTVFCASCTKKTFMKKCGGLPISQWNPDDRIRKIVDEFMTDNAFMVMGPSLKEIKAISDSRADRQIGLSAT